TSGYDVFVAQTPWPGRVVPQTQLVIRYHDAVPVFLPHTIEYSRRHNFFHLSALRENTKLAAFACVSEHSRMNLLRLFPHLEKRVFVVSDCIAEAYFPDSATRETVAGILASRVDATTEPVRKGNRLYDTQVKLGDRRFLLMVSTLEPRKNHLGLLAAWEALRLKSKQPIALVFVGSLGWGSGRLLQAMRKWQLRGELFHLSAVSPSELRLLYSAADAVICPSASEGFDLPSIEAMRCGAAVVASDIPVHREILGDAALYFDPYSTASICDAHAPAHDRGPAQRPAQQGRAAGGEVWRVCDPPAMGAGLRLLPRQPASDRAVTVTKRDLPVRLRFKLPAEPSSNRRPRSAGTEAGSAPTGAGSRATSAALHGLYRLNMVDAYTWNSLLGRSTCSNLIRGSTINCGGR